jgi:salicylate hydroxylase
MTAATPVLVAGGGIGGLAAALAATHAGWPAQLFEQAAQFSEVGAGVQSGPNVVRLLQRWGLGDALARVAAFPRSLRVRSAHSGRALGALPLQDFAQRYGAPYATIHRADLHTLLLDALRDHGVAQLHLGQALTSFAQDEEGVTATVADGRQHHGAALVGADGLRSRVRGWLLDDGPPRATGPLAYRALVAQQNLPAALRTQDVTVWLGPRLHVVQYPVHAGEWLNVVVLVEDPASLLLDNWDHSANPADVRRAVAAACTPLRYLLDAVAVWRRWALCNRAPVAGPQQMARSRVALLGDAAHPMLPYLAQGAGMAIEDAAALQQVLAGANSARELPAALQAYAQARWQRNARVQARSIRNGVIFHATGPMCWGRDAAMRVLGRRVLDLPWLYQES